MKVTPLALDGLLLISLDVFKDERGFFVERFNMAKFKELGLPTNFVQDNHSRSAPHVLRGLHFQKSPMQGKLVGVLAGKIFDVVVDLRKNSKSFGKHFAIELDAKAGELLWIPAGFAHGFCNHGSVPADIFYKVDALFTPSTDTGIRYDDSDLKIDWPEKNPVVSTKDKDLPTFKKFLESL